MDMIPTVNENDLAEYIEIRFGYTNHEMPASVFANYISNLDKLVKEISRREGQPHQLIITAIEPGSVRIRTMLALITTVGGLIIRESINEAVFSLMKDVITYYIDTSVLDTDNNPANKVENGDEITITDSQNSSVIVNKNVYNYINTHPNTKKYIAEMTQQLKNEPITGVIITRKQGDAILDEIQTSHSEIETLSKIKSEEIIINLDRIENITEHPIKITRIDFKRGKGWKMIYDGHPISVAIDPEPLEFLQNESISEKDTFIVNLSIIQKYNERAEIYENSSYLINDVIQHIPFIEENPELPYVDS